MLVSKRAGTHATTKAIGVAATAKHPRTPKMGSSTQDGVVIKSTVLSVLLPAPHPVNVSGATLDDNQKLANIIIEELNGGTAERDAVHLLSEMKQELEEKNKAKVHGESKAEQ